MLPRPTVEAFDSYLASRGLELDAVVIGGAALALLGITSRPTRDFDILIPALPPSIVAAARSFAEDRRRHGVELRDDWLDNGPMQLGEILPSGWQHRLEIAFERRAIVLRSLGRSDLLKAKLFALCDRGTDLADCVTLAPFPAEVAEVVPWLSVQDADPDWRAHVRRTLDDLLRRLGRGV